jgi:PAS domain S-box-containing protein
MGRDESADDRDRTAALRDRGADDRDALARREEQAASDRDGVASGQDQVSSDRDESSSGDDQRSADDDQRSADAEFVAGSDQATYIRGVLARGRTRRDRDAASSARDETSEARLHERDAESSGASVLPAERDRGESAGDREESAHDRDDAAHDRQDAAHDREYAAVDRQQALRDRMDSTAAAQRAVETLEAISDAFFTLDSEWRFTYLNPQTEAILERRREDLLGRNMWDEFPESVASAFDDEYQRALREQVPVRFEEDFAPLGRRLEVRAYPVPDGLAVYFTDVTDQRRRDEQRRQAQQLEAIGRVTAGVAHDFNNILAAVAGFAKLGQAASVDEKTSRYFDEIDAASERAAALTRQLLAFARQTDLSPTAVDLNDVAGGLSSLLRQLLPAGIDLKLALSPEAVPVFVDRTQLEQVLLNLVVNSRDAIDTTGTITVSTATHEPEGVVQDVPVTSGWLQVTDTGAGIAEDALPHIFDPFFSTKPPETGTGLGLATIYGIVSQSGGSIVVDSTVGIGTTMTIALPSRAPASRNTVTASYERRSERPQAVSEAAPSDDRPPICPVCGVTMVPAELSERHTRGDWVCLECEESGEPDEA